MTAAQPKIVYKIPKSKFFKMLGNSILLASIQASIGSVEMSSKFSVVNFAKDQDTLQAAADALTGYLIIACIWTLGSAMISFGQYSWPGLLTSLVANIVLVGWIFISYIQAFRVAIQRYPEKNLTFPQLFKIGWDNV